MIRCCGGSTTVRPSAPVRRDLPLTTAWLAPRGENTTDRAEPAEAWCVTCADCRRVLAYVEGSREEVYADL